MTFTKFFFLSLLLSSCLLEPSEFTEYTEQNSASLEIQLASESLTLVEPGQYLIVNSLGEDELPLLSFSANSGETEGSYVVEGLPNEELELQVMLLSVEGQSIAKAQVASDLRTGKGRLEGLQLEVLKTSLVPSLMVDLQILKAESVEDQATAILESNNCASCHGESNPLGGLSLSSSLSSTNPALADRKDLIREIWKRINDTSNPMPPLYTGQELTAEEKNLIEQWSNEQDLPSETEVKYLLVDGIDGIDGQLKLYPGDRKFIGINSEWKMQVGSLYKFRFSAISPEGKTIGSWEGESRLPSSGLFEISKTLYPEEMGKAN